MRDKRLVDQPEVHRPVGAARIGCAASLDERQPPAGAGTSVGSGPSELVGAGIGASDGSGFAELVGARGGVSVGSGAAEGSGLGGGIRTGGWST
jgi:hypothetical protein